MGFLGTTLRLLSTVGWTQKYLDGKDDLERTSRKKSCAGEGWLGQSGAALGISIWLFASGRPVFRVGKAALDAESCL